MNYRILGGIGIACFALAAATLVYRAALQNQRVLVMSTGSEVGIYHRVASSVAAAMDQEDESPDVQVLTSLGSRENIDRLHDGDADLAIIQNDSLGSGRIRSLASPVPRSAASGLPTGNARSAA